MPLLWGHREALTLQALFKRPLGVECGRELLGLLLIGDDDRLRGQLRGHPTRYRDVGVVQRARYELRVLFPFWNISSTSVFAF